MAHRAVEAARDNRLKDIVAADERQTSMLRQIFNGVSGLVLLMVAGLVVVLFVLWKAP